MDILNMKACAQVAGGDGEPGGSGSGGDGSVAGTIGDGLGKVLHGLASKEATIGGLISPVGAVVGAIIHFNNNH
ncbi:hypothetical protein [Arenimonas alkanexedens]